MRAVMLAVLGGCTALLGQTTGTIEGVVSDPSGAVIRGASVTVVSTDTRSERRLSTGQNGRYLAPGLSPGEYDVEVTAPDFADAVLRGLEVEAGRSARADFVLELGSRSEAVEVQAGITLVNTAPSDWGGSIGRRMLEDLPLKGRDVFDLAAQEAGASAPSNAYIDLTTGTGVHVSVNGARPNQNSFRIDGVYVNDAANSAPTSAAGRTLGTEGIQEIRLVTSPFSAEFGRAAGATLTAISRSGTNVPHGSLYGYFRNSALDAKNYFDSQEEPIPPLKKYQFGGAMGGPIQLNRIFYFVNYEGLREKSERTARSVTMNDETRLGRLPGQTVTVSASVRPFLDLFPAPNGADFGDGTGERIAALENKVREDYLSGKLDVVPSPRLRFASRYTFDDASTVEPDPFEIWGFSSDSRYQFLHTDTQFVGSPETIHNLRFGFSRVENGEDAETVAGSARGLSFVDGQPLGMMRVVGLSDVGGLPVRLRPRRYQVDDLQINYDASFLRGRHTLRIGGGYDHVWFDQQADRDSAGSYTFDSVADFLEARPATGQFSTPGLDSLRRWTQHQWSGYLQDEIHLGRSLSATLGVRYEAYSTPSEADGKISVLRDPLHDTAPTVGGPLFDNPSATNFGPRAAIAWDPTGSGRTVLRAGAGIFFDLIGSREIIIAGHRVPPFYQPLLVQRPSFPDLEASVEAAKPDLSLDGLDYHLQQPYVAQFQLALQHQLGHGAMLEVGYAGARGIHLVGKLGNINVTRPEALPDGRLFFPAGGELLNPAFEQIGTRSTRFNSFYHGLLVKVEQRWSRGFGFQAKYAFSKAIDEASSSVYREFQADDAVPTVFDYRSNRGLASFDLRHAFALNFSYSLPSWPQRTWNVLAGGWEISGLLTAQTGHPFAPQVGFDRARLQGASDLGQRPDLIAPDAPIVLGDPSRYFDPLAFALPAAGFLGNLGRNTLTGPGLVSLDAAVHKDLWTDSRQSVEFRVEAFNLSNHPNFQIPSSLRLFDRRGGRLGSAGRITSTTTPSRQIQLVLRYAF